MSAINAGGDQDDGVDDAATFADFHRQGVGGDEAERASGVQAAVAELFDVLVEICCHAADL